MREAAEMSDWTDMVVLRPIMARQALVIGESAAGFASELGIRRR